MYERMLADGPVHAVGESGFYAVCGWDAVNDVVARPEDFSSNLTATMTYQGGRVSAFPMGELGGKNRRLTSLRLADGRPLDPVKRYRIALNTFDARSAGHRFMKLRAILERPDARCAFHPVQTRETLIDYFRRHKEVHRLPRSGPSKAAA